MYWTQNCNNRCSRSFSRHVTKEISEKIFQNTEYNKTYLSTECPSVSFNGHGGAPLSVCVGDAGIEALVLLITWSCRHDKFCARS